MLNYHLPCILHVLWPVRLWPQHIIHAWSTAWLIGWLLFDGLRNYPPATIVQITLVKLNNCCGNSVIPQTVCSCKSCPVVHPARVMLRTDQWLIDWVWFPLIPIKSYEVNHTELKLNLGIFRAWKVTLDYIFLALYVKLISTLSVTIIWQLHHLW